MNCANGIATVVSAWARNAARNSGEGAVAAFIDRPIYKREPMPTVAGMFKRILTLAAGVVLGVTLAVAGLRMAAAWNLFPSRDLSRSAAYLRDVMRLVNENYVDEKGVAYDTLARNALHGMIESLDPHSEFLEKKHNEEFEEDLTGEFGGVGVQVETRNNRIVVIAPLAGGPSER